MPKAPHLQSLRLLWAAERDGQGNVLRVPAGGGAGVDDLVVLKTDDLVLVDHRDRALEVKTLVGRLEPAVGRESKAHRKVFCPWGIYDGVTEGQRWQVKNIVVNSGASLSMQITTTAPST